MTRDGHVRVDRLGRIDLTRKGAKFAERLALRPSTCGNVAHRPS